MVATQASRELASLLNTQFAAAMENSDESAHIVTADVAREANLRHISHDDQSGDVWQTITGTKVYGWEGEGGFSAYCEDCECAEEGCTC